MRARDLIGLSFSALWQQKVRVVLTTLGVVFGCFVLSVSVALHQGVPATIMEQYQRFGDLRLIDVLPPRLSKKTQPPPEEIKVTGKMSDAKRQRLQQALAARWQLMQYSGEGKSGLSHEMVDAIAALEHVRSVKPLVYMAGELFLGKKGQHVSTLAIAPEDAHVIERLVAGTMYPNESCKEAVISELVLYELGVRDDEQVDEILGKELELVHHMGAAPRYSLMSALQLGSANLSAAQSKVLEKVSTQLPEALLKLNLNADEKTVLKGMMDLHKKPKEQPKTVSEKLVIRGVVAVDEKQPRRSMWSWAYNSMDLALPPKTAEYLYFSFPRYQKHGFERLLVEVDDIHNVKEVDDAIQAMGLETYSLAEVLEKEQFTYILIIAAMIIIALIALLVAALGIINTMLMSVLERVREIGIMKAIGARESNIQTMFLVEGGLIGLVGGCLGLLLGWLFSFAADAWVAGMVETRLNIKLDRSLLDFPSLVVVGVPLFAWLTTTLAAFYPAWRAARIDPIKALRHE